MLSNSQGPTRTMMAMVVHVVRTVEEVVAYKEYEEGGTIFGSDSCAMRTALCVQSHRGAMSHPQSRTRIGLHHSAGSSDTPKHHARCT